MRFVHLSMPLCSVMPFGRNDKHRKPFPDMGTPMKSHPDRRRFLRSATTLLALPAWESLCRPRLASAAPVTAPPKRLVCLGIGYGVTEETWFPQVHDVGTGYTLPEGLAPLVRHRDRFSIIQGCAHRRATNPHGGSTFWLTGGAPEGSGGSGFQNSVSMDQVAAEQLAGDTRFSSLQLNGSEPGLAGAGHGAGLSLAWDHRGKPIAGFDTPLVAFHQLFAADTVPLEQQQRLITQKRSVLDTVLHEAKSLRGSLNAADRDKLDEYLGGIRDIEGRLAKEERWLGQPKPNPEMPAPGEGLVGRDEILLMYDLIIAALRTDSTRVVSFRQPIQHLLTSLGIGVAAHDMSHYHPGERMQASQRRDQANSEMLAGLLDKLLATREPDGSTLFDHTTVVFGSTIRSIHYLDNAPTLIAGRGAGLALGQHLAMPKETPLCNVWLTILQGMGVNTKCFGDSTGSIDALSAS